MMDQHQANQDREARGIFLRAIEITSPEARAAFIEGACRPHGGLRARVEALLANHRPDSFLESPAAGPATVHLAEITPPEGPDSVVGRYKLLQKLGEGGFGVVYMAEQREPVKRRVALKIIKLGMDTNQVVARFEAERQALAMMDHPNIARVFDAGATESGRPYFVMELVRGIPITKYCDENQLTTPERLELFMAACHAIQHAHQKGIIHRDVKPSNILVTLHDGVPVPKVIDFGIAKATQQELTDKTVFTQFQQMIGTPAYMSPEQAEMSGLDIDTRSDIYSLGVLLYELLTGNTPLDTKTLLAQGCDEIRRRIKEDEPAKPSTRVQTLRGAERTTVAKHRKVDPAHLGDELKRDLDWIVMKCLEKDRTRRYETANALVLELRRYLACEPVWARPPSAAYRLQKFVRRNRVAVLAAAAVLLALVTGFAAVTWGFFQERTLRQRAMAAEHEQSRLRQEAVRAQASEAHQRQVAELNAGKAAENEAHARRLLYAADMNLAQQALKLNNIGWAANLMQRHVPKAGERDLRGWEWRYLWQFCQSDAIRTVCQRPSRIHSLSVSRDGKFLAVGEHGTGGLGIWNLETRQPVTPAPESRGFVLTAFSPRRDWLAFIDRTEQIFTERRDVACVWDTTAGKIIAKLPLGGACCGLAFADDGTTLVAAKIGEIILWDVSEPSNRRTVPAPGLSSGVAEQAPFAFLPARNLAAHRSRSGDLRVVDLTTGEERWKFHISEELVIAVAFSPGGDLLAASTRQGAEGVSLWDLTAGREVGRLGRQQGYVTELLFWPDGKTLAAAGTDQTIRLWDVTDAEAPKLRNTLRGHRQEVWPLVLLPDQRTLVSGCKDGMVLMWDTQAVRPARDVVTLPTEVRHWRFETNSASILTLERGGRVSRWRGDQFRDVQPLFQVGSDFFQGRFSEDGRFLAVGTRDGLVSMWDVSQQWELHRLKVHDRPVAPGQVSAEGRRVAIARLSKNLAEQWDLAEGKPLWSTPLPDDTRFGVGSPDGLWTLVGGGRGVFLLRNMLTGDERRRDLAIPTPRHAAFSPDGRLFAVASSAGFVRLFETSTLHDRVTLSGFLQGVHSVAFSPDGQRLVSGGGDFEAVRLWDIDNGQPLFTLEARASVLDETAFSPDGNLLGSRSGGGLLHIWSAPSWEQINFVNSSDKPHGLSRLKP